MFSSLIISIKLDEKAVLYLLFLNDYEPLKKKTG